MGLGGYGFLLGELLGLLDGLDLLWLVLDDLLDFLFADGFGEGLGLFFSQVCTAMPACLQV